MTPGGRDGDDQGLLLDARGGDGGSIAGLYDRHANALLALARYVLGVGKTAEDAVVDTIVDACGRGEAGDLRHGSVRHELARATYQRCRAPGPLSPAARSRAVLALCLHGEHTYREAGALTGVVGASLGDLMRDALADRALPVPV